MGHVLPTEQDLAPGDGVAGVAHQGAHQGGFAGTVVAHEDMGLAGVYGQVDTVQQNFLFLAHGDLQIFDFQQRTAHKTYLLIAKPGTHSIPSGILG